MEDLTNSPYIADQLYPHVGGPLDVLAEQNDRAPRSDPIEQPVLVEPAASRDVADYVRSLLDEHLL